MGGMSDELRAAILCDALGDGPSVTTITYDDMAASLSRTPVSLVIIDLDYCANVFGVAPCTGTGVNCFNTFHTCRDRANYSKTIKSYYFVNTDVGTPFKAGERPYLISIDYLPTEIKSSFTISGRVKVHLTDEPDTDVGVDPYYGVRTKPVPGTFWKKLLARNPNYKGRNIYIYDGFLGIPISEYRLRWKGLLYNISIGKGEINIEATDPLKSIKDIYLPEKIELRMLGNISTMTTQLPLANTSAISTYAYFRCDDEIIQINSHNSAINTAYVERAVLGSQVATHADGNKLTPIWVRNSENPFTTMQYLLDFGGIPSSSINTTAFQTASTWPAIDPNVACLIKDPISVEQLYYELVDLTNCRSWYGEDQKITIQRDILNDPARTYANLTDNFHIIEDSVSLDLQGNEHITRCSMFWGQYALGDDKDSTAYKYLTISIDADAESSVDYNEVLEKTIYCRWLSDTAVSIEDANINAKSYTGRQVFFNRDPRKIMTFDIEIKDSTILTGNHVNITSDEFQDVYGNPLEMKAVVVKRESKNNGRIAVKCQALPDRSILIMASSSVGNWTASSPSERLANGFMSDAHGMMPDGQTLGYSMY